MDERVEQPDSAEVKTESVTEGAVGQDVIAQDTEGVSTDEGGREANPTPNGVKNGVKKGKKKTAKQYAISFFIKIGVTALVVVLLLIFVVGIYVNHSNAGYPMIKDGDLCLTFKLTSLHKGDPIVYERDGETKFGRIVAEAGDIVDMSEEGLTVNGYGTFEDTVYPTTAEGAAIEFPYTVPEDTVFVLNDYRADVYDSRTYGGIPLKDTKGKIILLLRKRGV